MSGTKLILFGGGILPEEGLDWLNGWYGSERNGPVAVIAWASARPRIAGRLTSEAFAKHRILGTQVSVAPPRTDEELKIFLERIRNARGIFFTGGDQNLLGNAFGNPEIFEAFRRRYFEGLPFGGTSAGTAIMSNQMFTGIGDDGSIQPTSFSLRKGLGLCEGVLFDQHFLKRQRQNRLFAAILSNPELVGIGVDEDGGLAIENGAKATVVGLHKTMRVQVTSNGAGSRESLAVDLFSRGDSFALPDARASFAPRAVS